ncbi:MAG: sensor histidine kinase [Janthinobacterium lividum]
MNSLPIRVVVLLGLVSVAGILGVQGYWVRRAFRQEERQLDQRLYVGLSAVATRLAAYRQAALPNQSPVSQVSSSYYVVNVNGEIDANLLDYFLRQEFARLDLHLDYEYAIYDCGTDRMVYGNYVSATAAPVPAGQPTRLPTYNRYTYYFGLYLPHRTPYFMSQLTGWELTSGLLGLVVAFFGYALLVILRQKRLAEMQRDFINALSHEFKTPIATIAISADVLAAPDIGSQPQRLLSYASIIREENQRLSQQVDKVLQLAKTEGRAFRLHREVVDLTQLLPAIIRQFDLAGKHPAGRLTLESPARPALVWADPLHLANVLFNLLDNAVKYAAGPPVVRLALVPDGPRLALLVADEGIGIAAAHQKQVFDKFFRVPAANDLRPAQGFGLGLYYVRNVALAHGWRLGLRSQPGQGSTFTLTFPPVPAEVIRPK